MKYFFFFQSRPPRKFDYRPVYYDKEKEEKEERLKKMKEKIDDQNDRLFETEIKDNFIKETLHLKKYRKKQNSVSGYFPNALFILMLIVLFIVVFYLIYS